MYLWGPQNVELWHEIRSVWFGFIQEWSGGGIGDGGGGGGGMKTPKNPQQANDMLRWLVAFYLMIVTFMFFTIFYIQFHRCLYKAWKTIFGGFLDLVGILSSKFIILNFVFHYVSSASNKSAGNIKHMFALAFFIQRPIDHFPFPFLSFFITGRTLLSYS